MADDALLVGVGIGFPPCSDILHEKIQTVAECQWMIPAVNDENGLFFATE